MREYFYQNRQLHTLKSALDIRSIFRAAGLSLAEHSDKAANLLETDKSGTVMGALSLSDQSVYAYMSYGHCLKIPSDHSMVGFDGQLIDPVLRAYLLGNGYRAFSPIFMRFSSPDSHSPFGTGGINSYCYCLDDPINRTDTSGHASTKFAMLPRSINKAWRKARENGWESILTNPNIISKIQPTLPSKDVVSLAHASKKIHTAVSIESNKIANSKISIDNVLQTRDMQFEGTLPSSVSTRRNDVILHAINQTETLQDNFLRLNETPTDLGTGRRHAIVVRPGRRRPTLSSHSSTDSIFDENGDIRGNPRN